MALFKAGTRYKREKRKHEQSNVAKTTLTTVKRKEYLLTFESEDSVRKITRRIYSSGANIFIYKNCETDFTSE